MYQISCQQKPEYWIKPFSQLDKNVASWWSMLFQISIKIIERVSYYMFYTLNFNLIYEFLKQRRRESILTLGGVGVFQMVRLCWLWTFILKNKYCIRSWKIFVIEIMQSIWSRPPAYKCGAIWHFKLNLS